MFKRRHTLGIGTKVRDFFWPRMGFTRLWRYLVHRLGRMQGTPYSIAAGFACGAAASFTPLIGFHFILAGLLAWAIRANILASAIGTAIGNPWTFPFIWLWTYKVGSWIVGAPESAAPPQLTFDMVVGILSGETLGQSLDLLVTMLIGGLFTGLAVWVLFYLPLSGMIHGYRARKIQRRAEAVARQTARRGPVESQVS